MAMESNIYAHYMAKQTAKGTPNAVATKRTVMVAGDFNPTRDDASEVYSDLQFFPTQSDWVNTLIGNGNPGLEATPGELAYILWLFFGGESVVAGTNAVHTLTVTGVPTSGTYTLVITWHGQTYTTAPIIFNAAAAAVQLAIETAMGVPAGSAVTTGAGPYVITFSNPSAVLAGLGNQPIAAMTLGTNLLAGGTTPSITDVVTTPGVGAAHTTTVLATRGFWSTHWLRVGATQVRRQSFNDCAISNLQIEGSTSNKAVRITPTLISLDPGIVFATDPTNPLPADPRPFLFTEGTSQYLVDGVALSGTSQFNIQMELSLAPLYGDAVTAIDLVPGNAHISVAVALHLDANGQNQYYKLIYGTPAPAPGAKPIRTLPPLGSWSCLLTKDAGTSYSITVPGVKWGGNVTLPPNPQGGAIELSLAGQMRFVPGQNIITHVVTNADAAYTV